MAQVERRLFFSVADVNHNPFPAQLLGDVLMLRAAAILCVLARRLRKYLALLFSRTHFATSDYPRPMMFAAVDLQ